MSTELTSLDTASQPCTIGVENYQGWKAIRRGNGIIDIIAVPSIGGRILQLRLGGEEYLYVNPRHSGRVYGANENHSAADWKNYEVPKLGPQLRAGRATWSGLVRLTLFWTAAIMRGKSPRADLAKQL